MTDNTRTYRRIAAEEAYIPAEVLDEYRRILASGEADRGFESLMGYFLRSEHPQPQRVIARLSDLGPGRIADMDEAGIDVQILALTAPGTQVLDPDTAEWAARLTNDRIAAAVAAHPNRYVGLAAVGFENAETAVAELERAHGLGLKGLIVNSHIKGQYLDHPRFFPILAKCEELGMPVYLHPQTLPGDVIGPWQEAGLDGAVWGFAAETGLHLLRMITSGLLDRLPNLQVVVGHLGEGVPFFLHRIDHMHGKQVAAKRYEATKALRQKPSEYLRTNVWITTSGMPWEPAIRFVREVVGADRVMYAMDYPYQFESSEVVDMESMSLSNAEKAEFFEGIASRVFGVPSA